jgi:hypothetical protein
MSVPTVPVTIRAVSAMHSLQMKALLLSPLSGLRRARNPSQPPQPPKRIRTSGADLPQNEQGPHGVEVRSEVADVLSAAEPFSAAELGVPIGISVGNTASRSRGRACRSSSVGNLATRVFQSAKPNCLATISKQSLCESWTFRLSNASRRDLAMVLASWCVSIILNPPYTAN